MCQSKHENRHILKFADYTVIVSLLHNNESSPDPVINDFISWCDDSLLEPNIFKIKDMIIYFRMHAPTHDPTTIKAGAWLGLQLYRGTVRQCVKKDINAWRVLGNCPVFISIKRC